MYLAHTYTDRHVVLEVSYLTVNKLFVKLCALLLLALQQLNLHPECARRGVGDAVFKGKGLLLGSAALLKQTLKR
jgi:hypothetical protein